TNGVTIAGGAITATGNGAASPDAPGLFLGGTTATIAGGPLNTSSGNLLIVAGTATVAIAGGSENSYVNGPLARVLPGGLSTGSTYLFPIGKSVYKAFELVNPTTGAGTVTVQAEVFDTGSGGTAGSGLDAINNNRYWNAQITAGSGKIITGPILYSLTSTYNSGGETFPIVVPANGGSNATNIITIKPASGATPSISGSSASAIIELAGADYVTIDGSNTNGGSTRDLTIQNTNSAANTAAVWLA